MIPAAISKFTAAARGRLKLKGARSALSLRKTGWAGFCLIVGAAFIAVLHTLFWQFAPSQEKTDFYEEVQVLLDLQRVIKERAGDIPTMDAIRDVVFGPTVTGGALRKRAEEIVSQKVTDETQQQYANVIKGALQRWEESSRDTRRERILFIVTFVLTGVGLPLALWWFGRPLIDRLAVKLAARKQARAEAQRKKRERAMEQARRKMQLRTQASSPQRKAADGAGGTTN